MGGTLQDQFGPVKIGTLRSSTAIRAWRTFLAVEEEERRRIGRRLADAREEAGLNQGQLAHALGYADARSVRYWEAGDRLGGFFRQLNQIATVLGKDRSYFLGPSPNESAIEELQRQVEELKQLLHRRSGDG